MIGFLIGIFINFVAVYYFFRSDAIKKYSNRLTDEMTREINRIVFVVFSLALIFAPTFMLLVIPLSILALPYIVGANFLIIWGIAKYFPAENTNVVDILIYSFLIPFLDVVLKKFLSFCPVLWFTISKLDLILFVIYFLLTLSSVMIFVPIATYFSELKYAKELSAKAVEKIKIPGIPVIICGLSALYFLIRGWGQLFIVVKKFGITGFVIIFPEICAFVASLYFAYFLWKRIHSEIEDRELPIEIQEESF